MARVDIKDHQPGLWPGTDAHIGEGELILPPYSNLGFIRCRLKRPVCCVWMLSRTRTIWVWARTHPPHRPVNGENCPSPPGIPKDKIQKLFLKALFSWAVRVTRSRLSRAHVSASPPSGFAQNFST